jgi:hypothetical protein
MRQLLTRSIVLAAVIGAIAAAAAAFAENVDPGNTLVGEQFAWGENVGWINAEPANNGTPLTQGVTVSGLGVTGFMYGENIGWINMSCLNNGTCAGTGNYGVKNNGLGTLTGYAWGENVGWISFSCTNNATCGATGDYGVRIDPLTGLWSGFAWGENIGWIKFDHSSAANRIKTFDEDTIPQATDNCKFDANDAQLNTDAVQPPGFPGADVFGDVCDADDDGDGCTDAQEAGGNPQAGGLRNPIFVWDFYDVSSPPDRLVDLQDTLLILDHFGHTTNDAVDNRLDREAGVTTYATKESTGIALIDLQDALLSLDSFGHSCLN